MQNLATFIAIPLISLYGGLNAYAGFSQLKGKEIPSWSAWLMSGSGLVIIASAIILLQKLPLALGLLAIGLITIHMLTIYNGYHLYGKINPRHHFARLAISIILLGLAFWNLQ